MVHRSSLFPQGADFTTRERILCRPDKHGIPDMKIRVLGACGRLSQPTPLDPAALKGLRTELSRSDRNSPSGGS